MTCLPFRHCMQFTSYCMLSTDRGMGSSCLQATLVPSCSPDSSSPATVVSCLAGCAAKSRNRAQLQQWLFVSKTSPVFFLALRGLFRLLTTSRRERWPTGPEEGRGEGGGRVEFRLCLLQIFNRFFQGLGPAHREPKHDICTINKVGVADTAPRGVGRGLVKATLTATAATRGSGRDFW